MARVPLLISLLLLAACVDEGADKTADDGGSGTDDGTDDGGDEGTDGEDGDGSDGGGPTYPAMEPAGCGLDYDYLPIDDMGLIVEHELDAGFSLPAAAIQSLLDAQGYGDVIDVVYDVSLHKVRYQSQDRGEPIEVTGYVAFPVMDSPQDQPVALWLHPTVGFGDDCAPSAGNIEGAAFPILWAAQGYVVSAPDYIGMAGWGAPSERMHPWVVAEPTAVVSLDSLRATAHLAEELGTEARPDLSRVVAIGASQGGHAALMVDHYAQAYMPELNLAAVVAAIPVSDLPALAEFGATTSSEATLGLAAAMVTMWDWYGRQGELREVLAAPLDTTLPEQLPGACDDFGELVPGVETVEDVFTETVREAAAAGTLADLEPWGCYLSESSLLRNTAVGSLSTTPKLIITGSEDTLAWAPPVRADVETLCDQGIPVEYIECSGLGHVDTAVSTLPLMAQWADRQLGGEVLTDCILNEPAPCED